MEKIFEIALAIISVLLIAQTYNYFFSEGGIRNRYCDHALNWLSFMIILASGAVIYLMYSAS